MAMTFLGVQLASDPLTRPYKLIEDQKAMLEDLHNSTRDAVWLRRGEAGIEIMPKDPEDFEAFSKQIESLTSRIVHNQEVLVRLEAECRKMDLKDFSLHSLINRRSEIPREIQKIRKEPDWELRYLFEAALTLGSLEDAEKHPKVITARAKAAEKARPLEEEAKALTEKITRLEAILGEFQG
jgi:DNA repair ATPase RecN